MNLQENFMLQITNHIETVVIRQLRQVCESLKIGTRRAFPEQNLSTPSLVT